MRRLIIGFLLVLQCLPFSAGIWAQTNEQIAELYQKKAIIENLITEKNAINRNVDRTVFQSDLDRAQQFIRQGEFDQATALYDQIAQSVESYHAQTKNALPLSKKNFDPVTTDNLLLRAGNDFVPVGDRGTEDNILRGFFSGENGLLRTANRLIGALAILYLAFLGVKYIFSQGESENLDKYRSQILWIVIGLVIVALAEFVGFDILDVQEDLIQGDKAVSGLDTKVKQGIRFLEIILGGFFLFNGILSGFNMILKGDQDDTLTKERTYYINFIIGVIFILTGESIIRVFSGNVSGSGERFGILVGEIGGLINLGLTVLAGACAMMMILASLYYVTNFGEEEQAEQAKKIIIGCVIGLVLSFSSYVIANFLII